MVNINFSLQFTTTAIIYSYIKTSSNESRGQEKQHASRQAVVSREAKKKQHAYMSSGLHDHYNDLFIWMPALKL